MRLPGDRRAEAQIASSIKYVDCVWTVTVLVIQMMHNAETMSPHDVRTEGVGVSLPRYEVRDVILFRIDPKAL